MLKLKCKKLTPDAILPVRMTEEAAGFDFYANHAGVIHPGEREMIKTGIAAQLPKGYWGFTRSRSGNAAKKGVDICSSSVIDPDYRGEVVFPLINHDTERPFKYEKGDRIGQMMLIPLPEAEVEEVEELDETERGTGGFGHTGTR